MIALRKLPKEQQDLIIEDLIATLYWDRYYTVDSIQQEIGTMRASLDRLIPPRDRCAIQRDIGSKVQQIRQHYDS